VNCRGVIRELSSYLDEELDAAARIDLEHHLAKCVDCRVVVDTTRKTIEIYCNAEPVPLPKDVSDRLHAALSQRLRRHSS
jgi:anti-sigma factor RsiW